MLAAVLLALPAVAVANVVTDAPAEAATTISEPMVIGVANSSRILSATGTSAGSYLNMRTYSSTFPLTSLQRWKFQMLDVRTRYGFLYHIKSAASDLCMTSNAKFGIYLQPCNQASAWLLQAAPADSSGYWLREFENGTLGQCLDADYPPQADPNGLNVNTCIPTPNVTGEQWRVRAGITTCKTLDITALCADLPTPARGVFANWHQFPTTFSGAVDAQVGQYIGGRTVNGQLLDAAKDWFEIGWQTFYTKGNGTRPPQTINEAYWQEKAPGVAKYHSLGSEPNGAVADGRNHSYMALDSGSGKLDILYDFSFVGTTTLSESANVAYVDTGVGRFDNGTATSPSPMTHRVQTVNANGLWSRLPIRTMATSNDRHCYGPSTGEPLTPPHCMSVSVKSVPDVERPPSIIESVTFTQVPAASPVTARPQVAAVGSGVQHGVDQRVLRDCLQTSPSACLQTVPGLRECVAARQQCSAADPAQRTASRGRAVTPDDVKATALRDLVGADGQRLPDATALTVRSGPATEHAALRARLRIDPAEQLITVTGSAVVHGLARTGDRQPYHGFTLTYRAATGELTDACLGSPCRPTRSR